MIYLILVFFGFYLLGFWGGLAILLLLLIFGA
jgi:hypothetical protein